MMRLDQAEIVGLHGKAQRLAAQARNALAKADEVIEVSKTTAITAGTAFAVSAVQAKWEGVLVGKKGFSLPLDLGVAAAAHIAAFLPAASKQAKYLHAVGDGALACFAVRKGYDVGAKWRAQSGDGLFPAQSQTQIPAAASGNTMSEQDLAALANGPV